MATLPEQSKPGEVTRRLRECAGGRDAAFDDLTAPTVRQVGLN